MIPESAAEAAVVLTTVGQEDQARQLARGLVESRLAACVTLFPAARSVYRWGGVVRDEAETLILIKTHPSRLDDVRAWLHQHHPYEVPEMLVLPVSGGSPEYLAWILDATRDAAPEGR